MITTFIVVSFILVLFFFFRDISSPKHKGIVGESIVARKLNKLPKQKYKVFHDIYLKTRNGSCQIDHVVVSIYGIFVIETKNYSGWIFGSENQEYWTQTIFNNKYKYGNPIKQNWTHIRALKRILSDYKDINYYSIIVFTGKAKLKSITSEIPVVYDYELVQTIMNYKEQNLSLNQIENIILRITENNIQDKNISKKHIQNIHRLQYEKNQKVNSLICPRCGGSLVIRNGPYDSFYGCSNYPNCRFKKNC